MAQQMKRFKIPLKRRDDSNEDNIQHPQIYAKDSLDRFGDDLCQLLLSYLSLEDIFRLECVSKQFRRTVFVSVVDFTLSDEFIQRLLYWTAIDVEFTIYTQIEYTIDTKMLATIAIKCANIETIDCRGISAINEGYIPDVLNTFRDKCLNLRNIYCNLYKDNEKIMPSLGPLVTRIGNIGSYVSKQALTHCHRLSQLNTYCFDRVFTSVYTSGVPLVKNLLKYELKFSYHPDFDNHRLSAFVAHNQSLRSVVIGTHIDGTHETLTEMCGQLSRLTQLRRLSLGFKIKGSQHSFNDYLRTIGVNCKQLQRLSFSLFSKKCEYNLKTLDSLAYFRRLKRLDLTLYVTVDEISLDVLRECRRLTHLDIYLTKMNANVFKIIRKNCPQLQYLCIQNMNSIIETECLDQISRLPALQMLVIHCKRSGDMAQQMKHLKTSLETTYGCENEDQKRHQPKIYAKNSMDRFGDDLCALLLSYLSFEDRFQCECVSKQLQRTVFASVVDITLSDRFIQRLLNAKKSDTDMLAIIAIKCAEIQTIDCRGITKDYEKRIPEVLGILRAYCRHLRDIYCDLGANSRQMMATFGPLVTRIGAINSYNDSKALTHCHRLSQLRELKLKKLSVQLSRLPQLRELILSLNLSHGQTSAAVTDFMRTIGVNCKQLQRLSLQLSAQSVLNISLDWLRFYGPLRQLCLEIYAVIDERVLEPLRHCKRLTHLEIYLKKINTNVLKDLHQYCPRLHYLFIRDLNGIIDTECLSHLSRLPALQMLVIETHNNITTSDNDLNAVLSSSL
ncbi:unnamed protein product [Medioppia subpectinata]|uniref:F-box domain-containing protein n=1 Tax=Medioppia subpectinata TaxID=1979941 RepID=A0A7R9KPL5_9ACAR|nr:unnamed protein product [Medioppia subpectinata]CAG2106063.1 unnamed protein product [Medioppia subpectinata]